MGLKKSQIFASPEMRSLSCNLSRPFVVFYVEKNLDGVYGFTLLPEGRGIGK